MKLRRLIALVAAATLAASCSSGDVPDPHDMAAPRSLAPSSGESGSELLTGEPLVGAERVRLSGWEDVGDDALRLRFTAGTPECFGAAVDVEESVSEVRVDVRVGSLEPMASADCIAIAAASYVDVELDSPIGDREVIDMNAGS